MNSLGNGAGVSSEVLMNSVGNAADVSFGVLKNSLATSGGCQVGRSPTGLSSSWPSQALAAGLGNTFPADFRVQRRLQHLRQHPPVSTSATWVSTPPQQSTVRW